jgi:ABC-type polysaccharide/polyol phosphate export permease
VLVASGVLASIVNLLISLGVFLLVLLLTSHLSWSGLLFLPLLAGLQVALAFGLGLFAAGLYTFLRDIMPALQVGFMVWFYLTPIIYPLSYVPQQLLPLFSYNPFTPLVTAYRAVLLEGTTPSEASLVLAFAWTAVVLLLGGLLFTRVEPGFADVL